MDKKKEHVEQATASYLHLVQMATKDPEAFSEEIKGHHQSGNPLALMDMIFWCATFGWKLPQWAADAFISGANKVRSAQVGSWDEAFGRPYPPANTLEKCIGTYELWKSIFASPNYMGRTLRSITECLNEWEKSFR
jgi:hypothetical protein